MSKQINIQRSIVVDLDWLEKEIEFSHNNGLSSVTASIVHAALSQVLQNSTPLSKVCEVVYDAGVINGETTYNDFDNKRYDKLKQDFLNSKIEIPD